MSTYSIKPAEINKTWLIIDAQDLVLGRLASVVAKVLRGKHKATFTPHMDCGDNVIIVNAEKVYLSGNKADTRMGKKYYRHTGYPGGIKEVTAGKLLGGAHPERVIYKAVERMITRGPLGRRQMGNLYIYKGTEHPHSGQQPVDFDLVAMNSKNKKR